MVARSGADQLPLDLAPDPPRRPRTGARSSFHVRSHVTAEEAAAGEARAAGQEACILSWIQAQDPGRRFTPSDIHRAFPRLELTSVRRALTNLSTASERRPQPPLVHHPEDRRPGPRGARESTWGLA